MDTSHQYMKSESVEQRPKDGSTAAYSNNWLLGRPTASYVINQAASIRNVMAAGTAGFINGLKQTVSDQWSPKAKDVHRAISGASTGIQRDAVVGRRMTGATTVQCLLDPNRSHVYDFYRRVYAEYLFSIGQLEKHTEILQYCQDIGSQAHKGLGMAFSNWVEIFGACALCQSTELKHKCPESPYRRGCSIAQCVVCRKRCTGLVHVCLECHHGGHVECIRGWQGLPSGSEQIDCPAGCGCVCTYD